MINLFKSQKNLFLGVDIGTTAIKLVELRRQGEIFCLEHYAIEPLPPGCVVEHHVQDVTTVGQAINHAIQSGGFQSQMAAVAVTGSSVITKTIYLPENLVDDELENKIQEEANRYYPLEDSYLDFYPLGPVSDHPQQQEILLAISRSEHVDNRIAALELAGLTIRIVDIEAYVTEIVFPFMNLPWATVALVDMGATLTTLYVFHQNRLIYSREHNLGGKQLTETVQHRYGLSQEEATLAVGYGGLPDNYFKEILIPFRNALIKQLERGLEFFFSASHHHSIDGIVLIGGGTGIINIQQATSEQLLIPVIIGNPFHKMLISSEIDHKKLIKEASILLVACGLALRGFHATT